MYIFYGTVFLILLAVDLFAKHIVRSFMQVYDSIPVIKGILNITYVQNTGAAFSIMAGKQALLIVMTSVMLISILGYIILKKPKEHLLVASLTLILSGGVGNLIDRVYLNYVVDFFELKFVNFAIFNTADIFVVCGTILLGIYLLFFDNKATHGGENANNG